MRKLLASSERIFSKDRESRFLFVSAGWLAAYRHGRTLEQVIGKTDFDIFSKPHATAAFEDEQGIIARGRPVVAKMERETFHDRPDAWMSTTKLPLRDESGEIIGTFDCRATSPSRSRPRRRSPIRPCMTPSPDWRTEWR
jgi:hypothetical protein